MHHLGYHESLDVDDEEDMEKYCVSCGKPSDCLLVHKSTHKLIKGISHIIGEDLPEHPFCSECRDNGYYNTDIFICCTDMEEVIEDEC